MTALLELRIACDDEFTASSLVDVLAPDNRGIPEDTRLAASASGRVLAVSCESQRWSAAISALNSILEDAALFQEVWLLSRAGGG